MVAQGEIWMMSVPTGKQRPVLVVTRNEAIPALHNIVIAPVTSTIRSIPTCVPVGRRNGIDHDSVATFDNLASIPKTTLSHRLGALGPDARSLICTALRSVADC